MALHCTTKHFILKQQQQERYIKENKTEKYKDTSMESFFIGEVGIGFGEAEGFQIESVAFLEILCRACLGFRWWGIG